MLRVGAILCPYCDTHFRKLTPVSPRPSPETLHPIWDGPPPPSPFDTRVARRSVIIAAIALVARIVLPFFGRRGPTISVPLTALAWGMTLLGVYAIYLARQAERTIDTTRDRRGLMMAKYGKILGMATIAYAVSSFVTSSIDQLIGNPQGW
jgi:hypothetical protein